MTHTLVRSAGFHTDMTCEHVPESERNLIYKYVHVYCEFQRSAFNEA